MQQKSKIKNIERDEEFFHYNVDLIIMATSLLAVGTFLNGARALFQAVVCVLTCVAIEYVGFKFIVKKSTLNDLSAVSTGLIIALLLPANAPFFVGFVASVFAILVAKIPFGSAKSLPFVPACVGYCTVSIFFPQQVFTFLEKSISTNSAEKADETLKNAVTLLDSLRLGESIQFDLFTRLDIFSGGLPGAIGTTSIFALLGVLLYTLIQRRKALFATLGYIGAGIIFALLFPRVNSGALTSIVMELCAGSFLFTALLLINDPITSPSKPKMAILYGAAAGSICMLLRYFGKVEDPSCFSVIIMNAIWLVFYTKEAETAQSKEKSDDIKEKSHKKKIDFGAIKVKTMAIVEKKTKSVQAAQEKDMASAQKENEKIKNANANDKLEASQSAKLKEELTDVMDNISTDNEEEVEV